MEEQARSLVTGHVKRYTEDSNTAAEVFRWVCYLFDHCALYNYQLGVLLVFTAVKLNAVCKIESFQSLPAC